MDNIAFTIFGFNIYWYAICIVSGMILAMITAGFLLKRKGYNPDTVIDLALFILPLAIIGARLYYVLTTLNRNWTFLEVLNIRTGGLAIYGGVIGGAIGLLIACRIKKYNFENILDMADAIIPGLILGQVIGRWGNFINQEAYGNLVTNTNLQFFPYAVFIDNQNAWYQATFFYESFPNFIGYILLFLLSYKLNGKFKGLVVCGYFVWYGIVRTFVEGLRSDSLYIGAYRISQVFSVILILAGIVLAILIFRKNGLFKNKNKNKIKTKDV